MTTESQDLQLANGRIASLEQEALTHGVEVQNVEARTQRAETRAQAAEDEATNDATILQQIQQEARDEANRLRESIKQLKQDLQAAKKALKEKKRVVKAKPEVAATRPNEDLVAENNNLRVQLDKAAKSTIVDPVLQIGLYNLNPYLRGSAVAALGKKYEGC